MTSSFSAFGVPENIVSLLEKQGIVEPTPIQTATIPDAMASRDVLGRGRTGSGKTLAFLLPILTRLTTDRKPARTKRPRALILVPTRELASQIRDTLLPLQQAAELSSVCIFGGVRQNSQARALLKGVDIVVACPGRLQDLREQRLVDLGSVEVTVIDEADQMSDMGFLPIVKNLLRGTGDWGQRMLFSATLDNAVTEVVEEFLTDPVTHEADSELSPVDTMDHHVLRVDHDSRYEVLAELVATKNRSIVFTRTKHGARKLAKSLTGRGVPAIELHGNLSQAARSKNMAAFHAGSVQTLVATDIAARGIHVDDVAIVVHADPPAEHKAYLHRSGRTARAGQSGVVVTLELPHQRGAVRGLMKEAGIKPTVTVVRSGDPLIEELAQSQPIFLDPQEATRIVEESGDSKLRAGVEESEPLERASRSDRSRRDSDRSRRKDSRPNREDRPNRREFRDRNFDQETPSGRSFDDRRSGFKRADRPDKGSTFGEQPRSDFGRDRDGARGFNRDDKRREFGDRRDDRGFDRSRDSRRFDDRAPQSFGRDERRSKRDDRTDRRDDRGFHDRGSFRNNRVDDERKSTKPWERDRDSSRQGWSGSTRRDDRSQDRFSSKRFDRDDFDTEPRRNEPFDHDRSSKRHQMTKRDSYDRGPARSHSHRDRFSDQKPRQSRFDSRPGAEEARWSDDRFERPSRGNQAGRDFGRDGAKRPAGNDRSTGRSKFDRNQRQDRSSGTDRPWSQGKSEQPSYRDQRREWGGYRDKTEKRGPRRFQRDDRADNEQEFDTRRPAEGDGVRSFKPSKGLKPAKRSDTAGKKPRHKKTQAGKPSKKR